MKCRGCELTSPWSLSGYCPACEGDLREMVDDARVYRENEGESWCSECRCWTNHTEHPEPEEKEEEL